MTLEPVDLSHFGPVRLRAAIDRVIRQQRGTTGPLSERLQSGAVDTVQQEPTSKSRYFQSILELGYLVASADGFAETERRALAALIEQVTGTVLTFDELELHFKDLDDSSAQLGRRERLHRAAADLEDGLARGDALRFATLVAIGDGRLSAEEVAALDALAQSLQLEQSEAQPLISSVIAELEQAAKG